MKLWRRIPTSVVLRFSAEEITRTKVKPVKEYIFDRAKVSLCQLLNSNTTKKARECPSSFDHIETKDNSVVVYISYMVHSKAQKFDVMGKLYDLKLSISSGWLLNISTNLWNALIEQFEKEKVAYPPKFWHNLFIVRIIDNNDVDTSSATAMSSFHETATSLLQKNASEKRNITSEFSNNIQLKMLSNRLKIN